MRIYTVSGPSGVGKKTLIKKALFQHEDTKSRFHQAVSWTTRECRANEVEGEDYHFVSVEQFVEAIQDDKFLEWGNHLGHYYGTPKSELEVKEHVILEIDCEGAFNVRKRWPESTQLIFILPPRLTAVEERIRRRGRETDESEISQRLAKARREVSMAPLFNYCLENDDAEECAARLRALFILLSRNIPIVGTCFNDKEALERIRVPLSVGA